MTIKQLSAQSLAEIQVNADLLNALENGELIYLPNLVFPFLDDEQILLTSTVMPQESKNISYDVRVDKLRGIDSQHQYHQVIQAMMARYVEFSQQLVAKLFPHYQQTAITARTSFRPAEIFGRIPKSYRKDDTRLHVDAFPASPCQGKRILRVFSNVNPQGKPRVWRVGEPFPQVLAHFKDRLNLSPALYRHLLKSLHITRDFRSAYDDLMLQLHNQMKADMNYQARVAKEPIELQAGATWLVFTDQVSHAALSGQFCLEQTFLLPVEAMRMPEKSPLKVLEQSFGRALL